MANFDPHVMAMRGRIGAYAAHAKYGGTALTQKARETFRASFETQVDPGGLLPPEERHKRAESAYRAHMARVSYQGAQARRKKAAARR